MGSDQMRERGAQADEEWRDIRVGLDMATLDGFYIGRYEVTVAQFAACVEGGGCHPRMTLGAQAYSTCPL